MKINPSILKRAAHLLDAQADGIFNGSATAGGTWPKEARRARDQFFELRKVARELRGMAQPGDQDLLEEVLQELVRLKDIKEKMGARDTNPFIWTELRADYIKNQPLAWAAAREAIAALRRRRRR